MLRAAKLAANAKPFRYLCYPVIGFGFLLLDQPSPSSAAAVLGWCLLWPLAVDLGQRRASAKTILNVHLAEAALASGLFAWASLPPSLLFAVGIIVVASNALQGGIRQALLAILCTMAGLAAGDFASPAASVFAVPAAAAFSSLLVLAYCALLGHWAHRQALGMAGQRAQMRMMNARLQQYLPHTLADRLKEAEQPRLERRWLVVAFADLAGFTPLVERLAVEELTSVLDSYLKTVADVTLRSGGTLSKVLGDGVMLVFGEAGAEERPKLVADALHCCRLLDVELTRLADRWRAQGMPEPVRLKIGVASGYCSLGDWGGGGRLEYTVIGQPVNLASRLEGQANAGEVLVCERTGLLAEVPLSAVMERPVKGLGPVRFQRVEPCAGCDPN
ncbi:MAG: adenylate/guanylate cyclase domain-containing protein [Gammaproteobacteria bacterium]|nr:adenylate/guanylate cyclase domain-containing protein [Gammaproteobacteria bacterium]